MIEIKQIKLNNNFKIDIKYSSNGYMLRNTLNGNMSNYFNANLETIEETNITIAEYEKVKKELDSLEEWFIYYDKQCTEYNRSLRLNSSFDGDIEALDQEAENKKYRINKLRELIRG